MVEIVCNLYEMEGISKVTSHMACQSQSISVSIFLTFQDTAEKNARMVFSQLDIDRDGELNEDEFVKGCLKVFYSTTDQTVNFYNLVFRTQTCKQAGL